MADFRTHVTFSSVLGCGYTASGLMAGVAPSTAFVAGGLCGVSGMLPDIDSDSGRPRREAMGFAAGLVPMLLVDRFQQFQLTHDQMVLLTAAIYVAIRFAGTRLIGQWTTHRGMFHSIPAALIFAGMAFLICGAEDLQMRYFKAFAVFLGTMSHLVLDEVYSVDLKGLRPKLKKSFGTAVKFWGDDPYSNFSTYAKLAGVIALISCEPMVLERIALRNPRLAGRIQSYRDEFGLHGFHSGSHPATVGQPGSAAVAGFPGWPNQPTNPSAQLERQPFGGAATEDARLGYAPPGFAAPGYPGQGFAQPGYPSQAPTPQRPGFAPVSPGWPSQQP